MAHRHFLLILLGILWSRAFSQSIDEKICAAMNASDWFALDSIYSVTAKDSINPFLETYSRFLIGNRFNRTDVSIPAFYQLLEHYQQEVGQSQVVSSAIMCAMDLSRAGDNARAASILTSVHDSILADGNAGMAGTLEKFMAQYAAMAQYTPYEITIEGDQGCVAFKTVPIGKPEDKGVHIHLENSYINGIPADILFDTGAGVNVISDSLVGQYDIIPIDVATTVSGAKSHNGTFAIVKELKMGNIIVKDVPFYVMDITANNAEANQYMRTMKIIVGSDLMLQLKDLTIDFENSRIIVPTQAPIKSDAVPNMCFSSGMNLFAKGTIHGTSQLMNVDTGDSSYGTLGRDFYKKNKKYVKLHGEKTKLRKAGIGGVKISNGYKVADMTLDLGGNSVVVPSFNVMKKDAGIGGYDFNLGLKSLMLYRSVRFNLVDFILTTEK